MTCCGMIVVSKLPFLNVALWVYPEVTLMLFIKLNEAISISVFSVPQTSAVPLIPGFVTRVKRVTSQPIGDCYNCYTHTQL